MSMERIIECVPNFSIGANEQNIAPIVDSIRLANPDVKVLDYSYDKDHGRLVVTIIGDGSGLIDAVYQGVKKAVELVNIKSHTGVHPCMGVVDVIPFVPLRKATFNDCVKLRNDISKKISEELGIPIYIYGNIAKLPERKELSSVRKGGIEGITERICTPEGKPDFGPQKVHATAGAIAIGTRDILIAFNVNLLTKDLQIAKEIAEKIREKNSGLRGIRAIGVLLESREMAQVAINITNYMSTSIKETFDAVSAQAALKDVKIFGSEIIGLIPKEAGFEGMEKYLKLEEWDGKRIIENFL